MVGSSGMDLTEWFGFVERSNGSSCVEVEGEWFTGELLFTVGGTFSLGVIGW